MANKLKELIEKRKAKNVKTFVEEVVEIAADKVTEEVIVEAIKETKKKKSETKKNKTKKK